MSTATTSTCGRASRSQIVWALTFFVSMIGGTFAIKRLSLPDPARYFIAIVPLVSGATYIFAAVRDMRDQMDELQLRIYLEAAAVGVCGMFVAILSYPLLQAAGLVGALSYDTVVFLLIGLTVCGYISAHRRYR